MFELSGLRVPLLKLENPSRHVSGGWEAHRLDVDPVSHPEITEIDVHPFELRSTSGK